MPYARPPLILRKLFNPIAMRLEISGTRTLAVRGRRSGAVQRVPLIPVEVEGRRYLVSPRGETDWVRNLRAAGKGELRSRRKGVEHFAASELPAAERPPVIAAYRQVGGRAVRSFFEAMPDPADHPVFRLDALSG